MKCRSPVYLKCSFDLSCCNIDDVTLILFCNPPPNNGAPLIEAGMRYIAGRAGWLRARGVARAFAGCARGEIQG